MKNISGLDELISSINKFPLLLLSSPRCGSTALKQKIARHFNGVAIFGEPDQSSQLMGEFTDTYSSGNKYFVLKAHSSYICNPYEGKEVVYPEHIVNDLRYSDNFFKIAVRRKDIAKQIASFYISLKRDIWYYDSDQVYDDLSKQTVPLIEKDAKFAISFMNKFYEDYSKFDNVNCTIYYEDFCDKGAKVNAAFTPQPQNYQEILNTIQELM